MTMFRLAACALLAALSAPRAGAFSLFPRRAGAHARADRALRLSGDDFANEPDLGDDPFAREPRRSANSGFDDNAGGGSRFRSMMDRVQQERDEASRLAADDFPYPEALLEDNRGEMAPPPAARSPPKPVTPMPQPGSNTAGKSSLELWEIMERQARENYCAPSSRAAEDYIDALTLDSRERTGKFHDGKGDYEESSVFEEKFSLPDDEEVQQLREAERRRQEAISAEAREKMRRLFPDLAGEDEEEVFTTKSYAQQLKEAKGAAPSAQAPPPPPPMPPQAAAPVPPPPPATTPVPEVPAAVPPMPMPPMPMPPAAAAPTPTPVPEVPAAAPPMPMPSAAAAPPMPMPAAPAAAPAPAPAPVPKVPSAAVDLSGVATKKLSAQGERQIGEAVQKLVEHRGGPGFGGRLYGAEAEDLILGLRGLVATMAAETPIVDDAPRAAAPPAPAAPAAAAAAAAAPAAGGGPAAADPAIAAALSALNGVASGAAASVAELEEAAGAMTRAAEALWKASARGGFGPGGAEAAAAVQSVGEAMAEMEELRGGDFELKTELTGEDAKALRTATGYLIKHRGGPGFGAGRLKGKELDKMEDALFKAGEVLAEETGLGGYADQLRRAREQRGEA